MFGIGFVELVVIFVVALLVFGPEKLPEIAKALGKLSADLKKASDSVRREFYNSVYTPSQEWSNRINHETKSLLAVKNVDLSSPAGGASSSGGASSAEKNLPEEAKAVTTGDTVITENHKSDSQKDITTNEHRTTEHSTTEYRGDSKE